MKSKQTKVWVLSFSRFARRPIFSRFQMSGKLSEKVRPQNEFAESSEVLAAYHVSTRYSKSTLKKSNVLLVVNSLEKVFTTPHDS